MGRLESLRKDILEVIQYRNVLRSLVVKNLFGKYKNSFLGFAWNFVTPMILFLMYYIIFSEIRTETPIENKWAFISQAIFGFHFLVSCITGGTNAFTGNVGLIKKMYVPKEILALSKAISSIIVCLIGYGIVIGAMLVLGYPMNWVVVLLLPVVLVLTFIFGLGCIFLLSTLAVYVRDIQYLLAPLGIAFFVLTPMRYMAQDATGILAQIIWYNPLTYFVEAYHDILYWGIFPSLYEFVLCIALQLVMLVIGYVVFRAFRKGFVKRL